nr:hypothetical protein Iba_chr12bCG1010 [Ipomoea batatas]
MWFKVAILFTMMIRLQGDLVVITTLFWITRSCWRSTILMGDALMRFSP